MTQPFVLKWDPEMVRKMDLGILYCPDCRRVMVLKEGPHGLFYSCADFPKCLTTHPAIQEGMNVGQPDGRLLPKAARAVRERCNQLWREKFKTPQDFFKWRDKAVGIKTPVKLMTAAELDALLAKLERARGNR